MSNSEAVSILSSMSPAPITRGRRIDKYVLVVVLYLAGLVTGETLLPWFGLSESPESITTSSSATAERGAVAAWWSEVKAYELEKKVARTRRVRARNSSYRDTRSRSLQRMVRRCGHWAYLGRLFTGSLLAASASTRTLWPWAIFHPSGPFDST